MNSIPSVSFRWTEDRRLHEQFARLLQDDETRGLGAACDDPGRSTWVLLSPGYREVLSRITTPEVPDTLQAAASFLDGRVLLSLTLPLRRICLVNTLYIETQAIEWIDSGGERFVVPTVFVTDGARILVATEDEYDCGEHFPVDRLLLHAEIGMALGWPWNRGEEKRSGI